ncbi:MAG: hypothetical protein HZY74_10565 [Brevundimonas sp.]|nr:MAG: hypothetical protein HZY74_10565 [Brevundimonas sp.]
MPLLAPPAWAQASANLDAFVTTANRIPQNPTAMLRSDTRRLMREAEAAIGAVKGEITAARTAGRTPPACPPDRISVNPQQLLGYLNAIPAERRRRMSVTDGFRAWMASRYPC